MAALVGDDGIGLPLALTLIRPDLDIWAPGEHNGTFRGINPALVTGTAALNAYWRDDRLERGTHLKGERIMAALTATADSVPGTPIVVRGRGLAIGLAFPDGDLASKVSAVAFEAGLLAETAGSRGQVVKLRRQGYSTYEISARLSAEGTPLNRTSVAEILAEEGFGRLLRRPEPRRGRFLAVASAAATRGLPMLAAYCAAKAGVTGLIRALATELRGTGVTANAVSPGSTDTPILAESARLYGLPGAGSFAAQQPLDRLLAPEEVAAALVWLAGDGSSGMTGAVVPVDGGLAL